MNTDDMHEEPAMGTGNKKASAEAGSRKVRGSKKEQASKNSAGTPAASNVRVRDNISKVRGTSQNMAAAKRIKFDEFYTRMPHITDEIPQYRNAFRNKIVYCNCDDPKISNFTKFFEAHFEELGLKKLITTGYKSDNPELFTEHREGATGWKRLYNGNRGGGEPTNYGMTGALKVASV